MDYAGRTLARAAMKQIVLAKSLVSALDRQQHRSLEGSDTNPATKVYLHTAEELLAICPFMRSAQVHKAQAIAQLHKWEELKEYAELCVSSLHLTMQAVDASPITQLPLDESMRDQLQWWESDEEAGTASTDTAALRNILLAMGSGLAQWYLVSLKNQSLSRTLAK